MADVFSLQGSLPDQLPIVEKASTHSSESQFKALPHIVSPKKRKPTKWQTVLKPKRPVRTKYFTAGEKINEKNARDLKKEPSPFDQFVDMEEFARKVLNKAWRNDIRIKELQKKVYDRPNYLSREKKSLLNRLYVRDPGTVEGKSVLSIDPQYCSIVKGRPISDKLNIKEYVEKVRESLRTRIVIGYREDDIMKIEETMKLEQKIIDIIQENLQNYINNFEEFLIKDHKSAMKLLEESEDATKTAYDEYVKYKMFASKYAFIRSSLYTMEEKWKMSKTYQKFLYAVSPLTWRMNQEEPMKGRRPSIYMKEQQSDDVLDIFINYRSSLMQKGLSLENIIQEFRDEIRHDKPAELYFTNPEQLLDVFRFIEMQNLDSLLYTEELAVPLAHINEAVVTAEVLFDRNIRKLEEIIEQLGGGISWEEQRATYLEELAASLIRTELRQIVRNDSALNLFVYVEDIYEYIIGPNDANITLWEMMCAIEEYYRHQLLLLDKVPSNQVAQLEGNYFKEETMIMKLAERASKQYAELERITLNVKKAYTPPPEKRKKQPKNRSAPVDHPLKEEEPPHLLTVEEMEYLEYFTDFCQREDDPRSHEIQESLLSTSFNLKSFDKRATKEVADLDTNLLLSL